MKQIKIVESNITGVIAEIIRVEKRATVNCLSAKKVIACAELAESRLEHLGLPKGLRVGAKFTYCPAGPWAKSYKFAQPATALTIVRRSSAWYVEEIWRTSVYPLTKVTNRLQIAPAQRDRAVVELDRQYFVMREEAQ